MIWLAGLHEYDDGHQTQEASSQGPGQIADPDADVLGANQDAEPKEVGDSGFSHAGQVTRYVLTRFAFPGLVVAGTGYLLARLGWNAGWVMSLYVILAVLLVVFQGFLRMRRSHELREVYFTTVFFLISGNLLQASRSAWTRTGFTPWFCTPGNLANTPMPYLLAMLVNMILVLVAGLMFDVLWRWQYSSGRGFRNGFHRAAWSTFSPLILVYIFALLFCCMGRWISPLLVFSVMGGIFMTVLVMRDPEMTLNGLEKRVLLLAAFGVILLLTAIGGASILVLYMESSPLAIPDHTILRSWEIDFQALGYSPDELLERYRVAAVLSSMSTLVYMLLVLGGILLTTIYRLEVPYSSEPQVGESSVETAAEDPGEKNQRAATAGDDALDPRAWLQSGWDSVLHILKAKQHRD